MTSKREPKEQVSHVIGLHSRGILGPSAMWLGLAEQMTPATATAMLESLRDEVQEQLLTAYHERPPHAYVARTAAELEDADFQAVCVQIVRWCEARRSLDRPSQPDGLIRVCIQDGVVKEWRPYEDGGRAGPGAAPHRDGG